MVTVGGAAFGAFSVAMVVGPTVGYMTQLRAIMKQRTAEGFAPLVSIVLLAANALRVCYWFGEPFSTVLLCQSLFMILVQLALVVTVLKLNLARSWTRYSGAASSSAAAAAAAIFQHNRRGTTATSQQHHHHHNDSSGVGTGSASSRSTSAGGGAGVTSATSTTGAGGSATLRTTTAAGGGHQKVHSTGSSSGALAAMMDHHQMRSVGGGTAADGGGGSGSDDDGAANNSGSSPMKNWGGKVHLSATTAQQSRDEGDAAGAAAAAATTTTVVVMEGANGSGSGGGGPNTSSGGGSDQINNGSRGGSTSAPFPHAHSLHAAHETSILSWLLFRLSSVQELVQALVGAATPSSAVTSPATASPVGGGPNAAPSPHHHHASSSSPFSLDRLSPRQFLLKFLVGIACAALVTFCVWAIFGAGSGGFAIIGYTALAIEATLLLPQIHLNHLRRSCEGLSPILVLTWVGGDVIKMIFFLAASQPTPFLVCGTIQLFFDAILIRQLVRYGGMQ